MPLYITSEAIPAPSLYYLTDGRKYKLIDIVREGACGTFISDRIDGSDTMMARMSFTTLFAGSAHLHGGVWTVVDEHGAELTSPEEVVAYCNQHGWPDGPL